MNTNHEAEKPTGSSASRRLSPDEAQVMVGRYGSEKAAAKALGVPRSTLRLWINPGRAREQRRRLYDDPEYRERANKRDRERVRKRYANDAEFRERRKERIRKEYHALSGVEYSRRLFRQRRNEALRRVAAREQDRERDTPERTEARTRLQEKAEQLHRDKINATKGGTPNG